jgi:hypothetical protein
MSYQNGGTRNGRPSRKAASKVKAMSFKEIQRECLSRGVLFEDPEFPARDKTIFVSKPCPKRYEWKRPQVRISYDVQDLYYAQQLAPLYIIHVAMVTWPTIASSSSYVANIYARDYVLNVFNRH